jgi:cyclopropane fatty-acyl-phospholipid synthase-like methyltransferase
VTYHLDKNLADALLGLLRTKTLLELGAGMGCYSRYFFESKLLPGIASLEGASNIGELTNGFVSYADLTRKDITKPWGKFDWVLCLEVVEHIPSKFEDVVLDNIVHSATEGIVLSWAVPEQPGNGHVNLRDNAYVVNAMETRGLTYDSNLTESLRAAADLVWFKGSLMIFRVLNE